MLTSISPLGERARGNRWSTTVAWFVVGSTVGGVVLGAAVGAVGSLLPGHADSSARFALIAVAALAGAGFDLSGRRWPGRRQVSEDWLTKYRAWVYGSGFGFQLGLGVVTIVTTSLVPLFIVVVLLADSLLVGVGAGAVFGMTRGLTVTFNRSVVSLENLRRLHARVDAVSRRATLVGAGVGVLVGATAVASMVGG